MWFESDDAFPDDLNLNRFENDNDLNLKWPGLTANLLVNIDSVHKALMFVQIKCRKYEQNDLMDNIQETEGKVFDDVICSPIIKQHESSFNLCLLYFGGSLLFHMM